MREAGDGGKTDAGGGGQGRKAGGRGGAGLGGVADGEGDEVGLAGRDGHSAAGGHINREAEIDQFDSRSAGWADGDGPGREAGDGKTWVRFVAPGDRNRDLVPGAVRARGIDAAPTETVGGVNAEGGGDDRNRLGGGGAFRVPEHNGVGAGSGVGGNEGFQGLGSCREDGKRLAIEEELGASEAGSLQPEAGSGSERASRVGQGLAAGGVGDSVGGNSRWLGG
jgi:hypothetical protein